MKVAKKFGYDFTVEELKEANKAYVDEVRAWKSIKAMFHLMKVVKAAEKEAKREARK